MRFVQGDLVWALWKDTKPYGAIVLDASEAGYAVRYADGVEATIKLGFEVFLADHQNEMRRAKFLRYAKIAINNEKYDSKPFLHNLFSEKQVCQLDLDITTLNKA